MKILIIILTIYLINMICGLCQMLSAKLWKVKIDRITIGKIGLTKNKMTLGLIPIGNTIKLNQEDVLNHPKQEWMLLTKQLVPYFVCFISLGVSFFLSHIDYFRYMFTASSMCLLVRLIPTANSEVQGLLFLWDKIEKKQRPITENTIEEINKPEEKKTKMDKFVEPKLKIFRLSERRKIIKELRKNKVGYLQRKYHEYTGDDLVQKELNIRTEKKRAELIEQYHKYNKDKVQEEKAL